MHYFGLVICVFTCAKLFYQGLHNLRLGGKVCSNKAKSICKWNKSSVCVCVDERVLVSYV